MHQQYMTATESVIGDKRDDATAEMGKHESWTANAPVVVGCGYMGAFLHRDINAGTRLPS